MQEHAIILQALRAWFHAAHQVTKGVSFAGDHELYGEIYKNAQDYYDTVIEKCIGITGYEMIASPNMIMSNACKILQAFPDPIGVTSLVIASTAKTILTSYNDFLKEMDTSLNQSNENTLGLNDFHASVANEIETVLYKLGQRIKTEVQQ